MSGPLTGVRVIDFTHVLAGPACGYYLSLLGADVIKVESATRGDAMRYRGGTDAEGAAQGMSTAYLTQGAGKRAVALDLDSTDGQRRMQALLAGADVFVENHMPATMQRLGLDEASVGAAHPRLIHCAMTGYGRDNQMTPSDVDLFGTLTNLCHRFDLNYGMLHTCTLDSMGHRFFHESQEMDHLPRRNAPQRCPSGRR